MNDYELIFLLEEPSMKATLENLLPKILSPEINYKCIPHEGKQDLERSISKKLKAWTKPAKFIVLRDKDSDDCLIVKQKLLKLCQQGNKPDTLIRIACHELESWFLGDLAAVKKGLNITLPRSVNQNKEKYRDPDRISNAKQELKKIAPNYQPISGSRAIARHLNLDNNKSHSFNVFIQGLKKVLFEISINS
ncbi:MAG: DUF4276 family protein [Waterburya sp.]